MSKPWDSIRVQPKPAAPDPIGSGTWLTTPTHAKVRVGCAVADKPRLISLGISNDLFRASDLRELAEFCTELADQLESQ